jgi:hypothetical protein
MSDQKPRNLPARSSFSTPHVQSFKGSLYFLQLLEQQSAPPNIEGTLEQQALSEAVQVFAAMTIEGAVNLLGLLVLGEDVFYSTLERKPIREKLSDLLTTLGGVSEVVHNDLLSLATNLSQPRNSFVHPKPQEGTPHPRVGRGPSRPSARQAVDEARRFLEILRDITPLYRPFFLVW